MTSISFDPKKAMHYEEYAYKVVFGYDQLFIMILSHLTREFNDFADILVVGCGTGMESFNLTRKYEMGFGRWNKINVRSISFTY